MDLKGKTALVTGGAVRIGSAICGALAEAGCNVVIHCNRSVAPARRLGQDLVRAGVDAWVIPMPLATRTDCERLVAAACDGAGTIDILINSAAVFHKDRLGTVTEARLLAEFRTNMFVPLFLVQCLAARTARGKVINLLDRRIESDDPTCLPYLLSKKALAAFTRSAALELAPGITVNAVAPGAVLPPPGKGAQYLHDRSGRVPLKRRVKPSDVAEAVVALLRLDAVTGQIVFVDGGQHLLGNGVDL